MSPMGKTRNRKLTLHQMFYLANCGQVGSKVEFDRSESRHITASLRAVPGDRVRAADGFGNIFLVEIESIKPVASGRIVRAEKVEEPGYRLSLYQAVIKPQAMEVALEMTSELGLREFVPVITQRAIAKITPARLKRLRKIAIEAMKQSLGAYLTAVRDVLDFKDAIEMAKGSDLIVFGDSDAQSPSLQEVLLGSCGARAIAIWIGPEGGFSEEEIKKLKAAGAKGFRIGGRRLRSETAAISAIAVCTSFLAHPFRS